MKRKYKILIAILSIIIVIIGYFRFLGKNTDQGELSDQLEAIIGNLVDSEKIHSAVVLVKNSNNDVVWQGSKGLANKEMELQMTVNSHFFIASITKIFTATLIMQMHEQGLLDINNSIADYLPKNIYSNINIYKGINYSADITVKQLLAHSSGIADYYSGKPLKNKGLFDVFLSNPLQKWTVEETINRTKNELTANSKPGEKLLYSDTNYQLLGKIIESVLDRELYQVYQDYIFIPLGLENTYIINYPALKEKELIADIFHNEQNVSEIRLNGSYWADGGMVSTADDCIRFLSALRTGQLICSENLELMKQWRKLYFPIQYGLGIMHFKLPKFINYFTEIPDLWGHSGSSGSFLYYSEEMDLYIAVTINQSSSNIKPFLFVRDILRKIEKVKNG